MEDLQKLLDKTPRKLRDYVAQAETWRKPGAGLDLPGSSKEPIPPFKFFQPVHGRFYLVAASLVCRLPGLPDHTVKDNKDERTTFVLRRLRPKAGLSNVDLRVFDPLRCDEYAWTVSSDRSGWSRVDSGLGTDEEQLPMSGLKFASGATGRRLFTGLVPASRRQDYVAGREIKPAAAGNGKDPAASGDDPRKIEFQRQVLDPWVELSNYASKNLSAAILSRQTAPAPKEETEILDGVSMSSALVLIDFANYLEKYLPNVWTTVKTPSTESTLSPEEDALYKALSASVATRQPSGARITLTAALKLAREYETYFETGVLASGQVLSGYSGPLLADQSDAQMADLTKRIAGEGLQPRKIQVLANAALDKVGLPPASDIRVPAKDPANAQGNDWYVVRCVYQHPECGLNAPVVLSNPSRPFQLASFFDPDAPARPIQVALPIDTTPATLRKYDKNVAFMISDELAKQMSRVKGLKQLMDGDLDAPAGLGMICSFSLPIITICALILLMIILSLLNLIFQWIPFFKICFPIPELKAKVEL